MSVNLGVLWQERMRRAVQTIAEREEEQWRLAVHAARGRGLRAPSREAHRNAFYARHTRLGVIDEPTEEETDFEQQIWQTQRLAIEAWQRGDRDEWRRQLQRADRVARLHALQQQ